MPHDLTCHYEFNAAGQGLFAAGLLCRDAWSVHIGRENAFYWIYDCGSTSGADALRHSILGYHRRHWIVPGSPIGLVAVSHFDRDHISGLIELVRGAAITTLLLPFTLDMERYILADEEDVVQDTFYWQFLRSPVAFLRAQGGDRIGRIVLVPPSTGEVPPADGTPDGALGAGPYDLSFRTDPLPEGIELGPSFPPGEVVMLAEKSALVVSSIWEFVPYNAPLAQVLDDAFLTDANKLCHDLRVGDQSKRKVALAALKVHFEKTFKTHTERNRISLFLYSGPTSHNRNANISGWSRHSGELLHFDHPRYSALYTGDGYLATVQEFDDLAQRIGPVRMSHIGVFQVMHHGAAPNCEPTVGDKVEPLFSVFSSDPAHSHLHPDAAVLRYFWTWNPVRVDRNGSAQIRVEFR